MKNHYQKYKQTSIESASREKLLLLLYEGCIKFMKRAIEALEAGDLSSKGINIGKAFDIVSELNATLNHSVGGQIPIQLEQLYMYVMDKLTEANIKNDIQSLKDAIKIMETLYSGWVEAVEKNKKESHR